MLTRRKLLILLAAVTALDASTAPSGYKAATISASFWARLLAASAGWCDGTRKFPSLPVPRYLFTAGNQASTRLISSVAVSIASRKAISLAGDGRPSNAASLRHSSIPAQGRSISSEPRHSRHDTIIFALSSPSVSLSALRKSTHHWTC